MHLKIRRFGEGGLELSAEFTPEDRERIDRGHFRSFVIYETPTRKAAAIQMRELSGIGLLVYPVPFIMWCFGKTITLGNIEHGHTLHYKNAWDREEAVREITKNWDRFAK